MTRAKPQVVDAIIAAVVIIAAIVLQGCDQNWAQAGEDDPAPGAPDCSREECPDELPEERDVSTRNIMVPPWSYSPSWSLWVQLRPGQADLGSLPKTGVNVDARLVRYTDGP